MTMDPRCIIYKRPSLMARESFLYVDVYLTLMSPFFCCCCFVIIKPFTVYLVNDYVIVHTRKKKKKYWTLVGWWPIGVCLTSPPLLSTFDSINTFALAVTLRTCVSAPYRLVFREGVWHVYRKGREINKSSLLV